MKRTHKVLILSLMAIGNAIAGCGSGAPTGNVEAEKPGKKAPQVRCAQVERRTLSQVLELSGTVEPYRIARIASPAEGPIQLLRVREGDHVAAGDALLSIGRQKGINAQITALMEDLRKEEENLRRTRELVDGKALAVERLDQAKAQYERVRSLLVKAEETAQDYRAAAPWPGVVSNVMVADGDYVAPRTPLVEIYDPATLIIRAAVPERYSMAVRLEMTAGIRLDAYPGQEFTGSVARVYPQLDARTRTRILEIELDEATPLLPGMFARLELRLRTAEDVLVVPTTAVVNDPAGDQAVFIIEDGAAIRRAVKTGIEETGFVEITHGINMDDLVVVAGNEKLKTGATVRIATDEPAAGAGSRHTGRRASPAAEGGAS